MERPVSRLAVASIAFLVVSWLAGRARAQAGGALDLATLLAAPAGAWAEYAIEVKGDPEIAKVRYALVERTATRLTLEIQSQTRGGPTVMRVEYTLTDEGRWTQSAARLTLQGREARPPAVRFGATPQLRAGDKEMGIFVGRDVAVTPAGRFDCALYATTVSEPGTRRERDERKAQVWFSERAPPTGLVKGRVPSRGIVIQLTALGGGAKSASAASPAAKP
jgi:hypothetical protein